MYSSFVILLSITGTDLIILWCASTGSCHLEKMGAYLSAHEKGSGWYTSRLVRCSSVAYQEPVELLALGVPSACAI